MKKITVAPLETLIIHNGNVHLTNTNESSSIVSGAFILNGGVAINSTYDSISSSAGGSLTVGGGVGIMKNLYVGKDLVLDNSNSVFRINGVSENRLFLDNIANKRFYISLDGINKRFELFDTYLSLNYTSPSVNSSSGSFILNGGISINSTTDASNVSSGGALTIAGGTSISKNAYLGQNLYVQGSNYIEDSLYVKSNITASNIYLTSGFTSSNLLSTNINATNISTSNIKVSTSIDAFGNSNTIGNIFTTGGNIGIGNISPSSVISINVSNTMGQIYLGNGIQNRKFVMFSSEDSEHQFYGMGINPFSYRFQVDTTSASYDYYAATNATSSNLLMKLNGTGNLDVYGNVSGYTFTGGNMELSGNIKISDSITSAGIFVDGNVRAVNYTGENVSVSGHITTASIIINSGMESMFKSITGGSYIYINSIATNNTSGYGRIGVWNSNNSSAQDLILQPIGNANVGIGTTTPAYKLDVNGIVNAITYTGGNIAISNGITTGNIIINGTFDCSNTSVFAGNTTSINSSTGSVVLTRGGLGINATANSANATNGGSLTVNGGAAIGKDLYIGGNLNVLSNNNTLGSLFTTNITSSGLISSTIVTTNISTGTLEVSSSLNAFGNSNTLGNIFTTGGSVGIGTTVPGSKLDVRDVGSVQFNLQNTSLNPSQTKIYSHTDGRSYFQSFGDVLFTGIDSDAVRGLCVKTTGNVGINTTLPSYTLDVNGSIKGTNYTGENIQLSGNITSGGLAVRNGSTTSVLITDNINVYSTTASNNVSTGSLVVSGGVGVGGNLNVLGNTVINGNLTVSGSTITVESTNTTIKDNILVLNSGPSGTRDSGFIVQRYQNDNDTGSGDVITDNRYISDTLPNQTGIISTQVKLSNSASLFDNFYTGWWIKVTSGFSINQVRKITNYVGSTRIATISSEWTTQNPAGGDNVYLYNKPYVGIVYNEVDDNFVFGSTIQDPGQTNVTFSDNIPLKAFSSTFTSTQNSSNSTTGGIVLSGGIGISNTSDASSTTNGGSFTSLGGGSFNKSLYVGGNLSVNGPIMKIPTGDTASRPNAPEVGYIYYNTDDTEYQGYLAGSWVSLSATGQLGDLDGNTKIMAEEFTGSNDNNLKFFTNGVERMRMNSSGNIGINTTAPNASVEINGSVLLSTTTNAIGVGTGGNLTVLGGASFSKDVYVGGTITSSSDIRLKDNIQKLKTDVDDEQISDKLTKLRTIKFNYKHDPEKVRQYGFIAQDFITDFPELLRIPDENGYYTLDYSKITVLLVESVKELKEEIKILKDELKMSKMK